MYYVSSDTFQKVVSPPIWHYTQLRGLVRLERDSVVRQCAVRCGDTYATAPAPW